LFHLTEKQTFDLQIKLGNSAFKPISDPNTQNAVTPTLQV
jgi:hypothetical protein